MLQDTAAWLSRLWHCSDYDVAEGWGHPLARAGLDAYDVLVSPSLLLGYPSVFIFAWADLIQHSTTRVSLPPTGPDDWYVPDHPQAAGRWVPELPRGFYAGVISRVQGGQAARDGDESGRDEEGRDSRQLP